MVERLNDIYKSLKSIAKSCYHNMLLHSLIQNISILVFREWFSQEKWFSDLSEEVEFLGVTHVWKCS